MMKKMTIMWHQITTTNRLRLETVFRTHFLIAFAAPALIIAGLNGEPEDVQIQEVDNSRISSDHKMGEESRKLWDLINQCTHRLAVNASGALEIGCNRISMGAVRELLSESA
jgi:hypothetical protein